jgi:hypothetical protein
MDYETLFRAGAVVAAVALLAGPRLVATVTQAFASRRRQPEPEEVTSSLADAHTILEIASRLRTAGNAKGVELCQQLLEVMLSSEKKA